VNHFVQKFRIQFGRNIRALDRESLRRLQSYTWPGNIRELEHVIERAVLLTDDDVLTVDLSGPKAKPVSRAPFAGASQDLVPLDELERTYLQRVLESTGGMIEGTGGAAEILKLKASTLRSRLKRLGVPYGNRRRITTSSQRKI